MKGKVWAAAWAILCASWIYDFVMLFYGVDGSKAIQGCAFLMAILFCAKCCIESLEKGDHK